MFTALLLSVGIAGASPTLLYPNAAPAPKSTGQVGASAITVIDGDQLVPSYGVEAEYAPTDRLQLSLIGNGGQTYTVLGGVRYLAIDKESFGLAPYAHSVAMFDTGTIHMAGGVALYGDLGRVRLDGSLSLVGLTSMLDTPTFAVSISEWTSEIGVSLELGERDVVRLGSVSRMPTVSWQHTAEHLYVDLDVAWMPKVALAGQTTVGVRF